jgi:asparagine synthase (glutamine-hydrolysing)
MTFCSDSILAKVDRASMAHSLEVRVPFLDHRLIEWAFVRPDDLRAEVDSKMVLQDYLRPHVPSKVLSHPKQGFSLQVLDTFNWEAAVDRIQQGTWIQEGYWSRNWKRFIGDGVPYRTARIWNLLMLTMWADAWLGKEGGNLCVKH